MNRRRKKILIAVIIFFAVVCLSACGYLIFRTVQMNAGAEDYSRVQGTYLATQPTAAQATTEAPEEPEEPGEDTTQAAVPASEQTVDLASLMKVNPEVYAWLYVPETNVNYPVVQSAEYDNFYLDHNVYKNYSFPGAIYSQSCNSRDWNDRVTVLYGHNMLDGSMFATIHYFSDPNFFNEHPYFYIYTADRKLTYEVVTAFDYDSTHIMNAYDFTQDSVFQDWLDQAKNPRSLSANVRESVELSLDSKFVVLSTCQNYGDGRFLVQGVLTKDERIQNP